MDFKGILDQVFSSSSELTRQATSAIEQNVQGGMSDMTKGAVGGAVGGSLLTLLVGSKKGRRMGKKRLPNWEVRQHWEPWLTRCLMTGRPRRVASRHPPKPILNH